jgi:formyltetrahydrofolate hydrolase
MKQFASITVIGRDKTGVIAQGSFQIPPGATFKDIVARGRKLEASVLVKAVKLYLGKRLDVYWGVVKEV